MKIMRVEEDFKWYQEVIAIMYIGNNREIVVSSDGMLFTKTSV